MGLVIFDILLSIWLARMMALTVQATVLQLDKKIAEALQNIIAQGIGDFEPPNQIQLAIADLLRSRLAEARGSGEAVEMLRASDGKFSG